MDTTFAISYAISKQLAASSIVSTTFRDIPLDDEMRAALDATLRSMPKRRVNQIIVSGQP